MQSHEKNPQFFYTSELCIANILEPVVQHSSVEPEPPFQGLPN